MSETPVCTARHVNHVCIAVSDIDDTLRFYRRTFGVGAAEVVELEDQGVRAALVRVGEASSSLYSPPTRAEGWRASSNGAARACTTSRSRSRTCRGNSTGWLPMECSLSTRSLARGCQARSPSYTREPRGACS